MAPEVALDQVVDPRAQIALEAPIGYIDTHLRRSLALQRRSATKSRFGGAGSRPAAASSGSPPPMPHRPGRGPQRSASSTGARPRIAQTSASVIASTPRKNPSSAFLITDHDSPSKRWIIVRCRRLRSHLVPAAYTVPLGDTTTASSEFRVLLGSRLRSRPRRAGSNAKTRPAEVRRTEPMLTRRAGYRPGDFVPVRLRWRPSAATAAPQDTGPRR